ncbi:MAG TPA: acyltransferase family protein [Lacipirellulaceae bacterium]|nr:acyltransferase family protein [Lacipirellulaceae bacterium]
MPLLRGVGNTYRPEIDGLRALSILCVIFYHLKITPFSGGYVGVDVFFVISGYLITRNIVRELDANEFSLVAFYTRRIRRLFPALMLVVAVTFALACLLFPPDLFRSQARDSVTILASVSNVFFWRSSNEYFNASLHSSPLLHTWSLSVEEQFYLVWSVGLSVVARAGRRRVIPIVILIASVISLAASQIWLKLDPNAAFYLMPFRIFELGIGALCLWLEQWRLRYAIIDDLALSAGVAAILFAAIMFGPTTSFPGVNALLPCIGAAAVIYAGSDNRLVSILNNRLAVGLGLISYSLYLCHWPMLVFADWIFGTTTGLLAKSALLAASIVVAALMYLFVETPFRRRAKPITIGSFSVLLARCAFVAALVFVPALFATMQGGWAWRVGERQREIGELQSFGYAPCVADGTTCVFGDRDGKTGMVLIGDSYAQHLVAAFQPLLVDLREKGIAHTYGGCLMLSGIESVAFGSIIPRCRTEKEKAFEIVRNNPGLLVINESWLGYGADAIADDTGDILPTKTEREVLDVFDSALERTVAEFSAVNRHFLIVGAQPFNNCGLEPFRLQPGPIWRPVAMCSPISSADMHAATDAFNDMLRAFQRRHPQTVSLLFPTDYLCDPDCPMKRDGLWLYQDRGHLTVAGARYLGERAEQKLRQVLTKESALMH